MIKKLLPFQTINLVETGEHVYLVSGAVEVGVNGEALTPLTANRVLNFERFDTLTIRNPLNAEQEIDFQIGMGRMQISDNEVSTVITDVRVPLDVVHPDGGLKIYSVKSKPVYIKSAYDAEQDEYFPVEIAKMPAVNLIEESRQALASDIAAAIVAAQSGETV